ncbi:hypothetical protein HGG64_00850 [Mycoplasma phocoeninasale]|uniref:Uncharacterized protein n=1 Tax=Mycoplasma phocoeninasale TaxID=2726117 RepID=A0A858U4V8_9MOLU|nr:hypothetical protein [Mycoplasma phocoeninasale]QJG66263.1 hypothetical protein HGG64_00850 [Mycoplasma phocoeninasale]
MQKSIIDKQKIFDDYDGFSKAKKINKSAKILKIIAFALFIVMSALLLFFAPRTIFAQSLLPFNSLRFFFNFDSFGIQQLNILILFRMFLLGFVFIFSFYKNFINISLNQHYIKKYYLWFAAYLSLSIASFLLFFLYFENLPVKLVHLSLILVALYLINLGYSIQSMHIKMKSEPLVYKNRNILIITSISQLISLGLVLGFVYGWNHSSRVPNFLFQANSFYTKMVNLFTVRSISNLLAIIAISLLFALLVVGNSFERINLLTQKGNAKLYLKNLIILNLGLAFVAFLWLIRMFPLVLDDTNVLKIPLQRNYLYLLQIIIPVTVLGIYAFLVYSKNKKIQGTLKHNLFLAIAQSIIWFSLLIINVNSQDEKINIINLFFSAIAAIAIISLYFIRIKSANNFSNIFIVVLLMSIITTLLIFAVNHLLIEKSNANYLFYVINSNISIHAIMIVVTFTISLIFLLSNISYLTHILFRVKNNQLINQSEIKVSKEFRNEK